MTLYYLNKCLTNLVFRRKDNLVSLIYIFRTIYHSEDCKQFATKLENQKINVSWVSNTFVKNSQLMIMQKKSFWQNCQQLKAF